MTGPAEVVSQMIAALAEETSKSRRRTHANAAHAALLQLLEEGPPVATEVEAKGFERGFLAAMDLLREVQRDLAAPIRAASYREEALGKVAASIDAALHYADTLIVKFEIRANIELRLRLKEKAP